MGLNCSIVTNIKYPKNALNCVRLNKIGLDQNFIDNEKEKPKNLNKYLHYTNSQGYRFVLQYPYFSLHINSVSKTQS